VIRALFLFLAIFSSSAVLAQHPATCRIVNPVKETEEGFIASTGTGTLLARTETHGIVVTCAHVVDDCLEGKNPIVIFPNGFKSKAIVAKSDTDSDIAVLLIVRPDIEPLEWSPDAVKIFESLTVCGYDGGAGLENWDEKTGLCRAYLVTALDRPQDMFTVDVLARHGDSGGPVFDDEGHYVGMAKAIHEEDHMTLVIHASMIEPFVIEYIE
jgi:S1-C subfamily serine protease